MIKKIQKFLIHIIAGANIITSLLLLFVCLTTYLHPADYPRMSLMGLSFPVFWGLTLLFFLFWLVFYVRMALISAAALLLCFPFAWDYCPINWKEDVPPGALKMVTYNIEAYGGPEAGVNENNQIAQYLLNSQADIICLQEAAGSTRTWLDKEMEKAGYHVAYVPRQGELLEHAYFKMPVLSVEPIKYESESNGSVAYHVLFEGDTLLVINNHFESNHLTLDDKTVYKDMILDPEEDKMKHGTRLLMNKMAHAAAIRGPQVDIVDKYIKRDRHTAAFVCGDFNDSPVSYTCRVLGKNLKSAFASSGRGLGISYNKDMFYVRIDHIFHSESWKSYGTYVDKSISASDHYPLVTYLKKVNQMQKTK